MFGIGGFELLLIVVFVLLVFGPDKLPEIGKMVGRGIRMFNDARHEVESVVNTQILRPEDIEAFGTLTGKRPYSARPKSASPVKNAVTAQQELEAQRAAEAARVQAERGAGSATGAVGTAAGSTAAASAGGDPAAEAASGANDAAVAKSLAVAQAEARAAEAAKRAAEAEMLAAEASLRAAEAEAAAAAVVAGSSE